MDSPRVSVLLSVRNGEDTLTRALDSLRAQTYPHWELVVVNDGSTDGTALLLDDVARQEPKMRVLHQPPEGLVSALNAGLQECQGEYIARMDADDYCYPERLARQVAHLDANPTVAIVSSRVRHAGDPKTQQGYAQHVAWLNDLLTHEEHYQHRFVDQPLANPAAMLRRSVFERVGEYRAGDFPEDYEFWLRCLQASLRMEKLPEVLLDWYDLPTRATRNLEMYREEAFHRTKADYWGQWAREKLGEPGQIPIWIWGVSKQVRRKSQFLAEQGWEPEGYIDITDRSTWQGKPVRHFSTLADLPEPFHILVYVANRKGKKEIQSHLERLGWQPTVEYHLME